MTPELEQRRGEEARRVLEHPLLTEAFSSIEANLRRQWEASAGAEADLRERLWLMLRLLRRLQGLLTEVVETGRLAEAQLVAIAAAEKGHEEAR